MQVVKPIVETDISRAASSFAKDSTLIKYRYSIKYDMYIQYSTVQYSTENYSTVQCRFQVIKMIMKSNH